MENINEITTNDLLNVDLTQVNNMLKDFLDANETLNQICNKVGAKNPLKQEEVKEIVVRNLNELIATSTSKENISNNVNDIMPILELEVTNEYFEKLNKSETFIKIDLTVHNYDEKMIEGYGIYETFNIDTMKEVFPMAFKDSLISNSFYEIGEKGYLFSDQEIENNIYKQFYEKASNGDFSLQDLYNLAVKGIVSDDLRAYFQPISDKRLNILERICKKEGVPFDKELFIEDFIDVEKCHEYREDIRDSVCDTLLEEKLDPDLRKEILEKDYATNKINYNINCFFADEILNIMNIKLNEINNVLDNFYYMNADIKSVCDYCDIPAPFTDKDIREMAERCVEKTNCNAEIFADVMTEEVCRNIYSDISSSHASIYKENISLYDDYCEFVNDFNLASDYLDCFVSNVICEKALEKLETEYLVYANCDYPTNNSPQLGSELKSSVGLHDIYKYAKTGEISEKLQEIIEQASNNRLNNLAQICKNAKVPFDKDKFMEDYRNGAYNTQNSGEIQQKIWNTLKNTALDTDLKKDILEKNYGKAKAKETVERD